jgi:hypothetical protein
MHGMVRLSLCDCAPKEIDLGAEGRPTRASEAIARVGQREIGLDRQRFRPDHRCSG